VAESLRWLSRFMFLLFKRAAKFVIVLLAMTVACTIAWEMFVNGTLYNCTDPGFLDFLSPGDWVHFDHGVVYVPHIVNGRSMSDPDTIKEGWSVTGLWVLWYSFVAISLFVSVLLARKTWFSGQSDPTQSHTMPNPTAAPPSPLNKK
jgi:hypothetical protein